jgi:hypothetical protein
MINFPDIASRGGRVLAFVVVAALCFQLGWAARSLAPSPDRFQFVTSGDQGLLWRVDKLSGNVCWAIASPGNRTWHAVE